MWAFPTVHCEAQRRGIDETLRVYVYSVLSDLVFLSLLLIVLLLLGQLGSVCFEM